MAVAGGAQAQAPALDAARSNPERIINEAHLQLVPAAYYVLPGDMVAFGAMVERYRVLRNTGGTDAELDAQPIGAKFADRRLVGKWTPSYGAFRFTQKPDLSQPFAADAGIVAPVDAAATHFELSARNLKELSSSLPNTRLTLMANGVSMGQVTMGTGGFKPYRWPLALQDRFGFQLTGPGTATVTAVHLYENSGGAVSLLHSHEGLNIQLAGGGAAVSQLFAYAGPATDCALRVAASGVGASTRLVMTNATGGVIARFTLANGANTPATADPDPIARLSDNRVSHDAGEAPGEAPNTILWAEDFRRYPAIWTGPLHAGGVAYSDGSKLILEGSRDTGNYIHLNLPASIDFGDFPYLTMRMRASLGATCFIRPYEGETQGWVGSDAGLEKRPGKGTDGDGGWETVTFNMRTMQRVYKPETTRVNRFVLAVYGDAYYVNPPAGPVRFEVDWMAVHRGIVPEELEADETSFGNNLDDDGDGLVDRDDDNFRRLHPRKVLSVYQTIHGALKRGGWNGVRSPGTGQSGGDIVLDANQFDPGNATKRIIRSVLYPLDYVSNPGYSPPAGFNEFADEGTNGIWNPAAQPYLPPTRQFGSGFNYATLGGVEEYDPESRGWVTAQADLARRHGIDGFIYNDHGLQAGEIPEKPLRTMAQVLDEKATGAWKARPFQLASFYPAKRAASTNDVVKDFGYILNYRGANSAATLRENGKPLVFCFPTGYGTAEGWTVPEWQQIFDGLRNLPSSDYDGAFASAAAQADATNALTLTFDRWHAGSHASPAAVDYVEVLDGDMKRLAMVDLGNPAGRASLLDGWGADHPVSESESSDFTYVSNMSPGDVPGQARLKVPLSASARFVRVMMIADGTVNGVQQHCELRWNATAGAAGAVVATEAVWAPYLMRLRGLPAAFGDVPAASPTAELPLSIWGDVAPVVRNLGDSAASGFAGSATYSSSVRDVRVEVSYPQLAAGTVRPGFDDSGFFYYTTGSRPYFGPALNGATYRAEWERLIDCDADYAIITSWNEYGEATNIEPTIEYGFDRVRLTLTYSLIYKEILETGLKPSATNLKVTRFDLDGPARTIQFTMDGADTLRWKNLPLGVDGRGVTRILRNGQPVALGGVSGPGDYPELTIVVPAGGGSYQIDWTPADEGNYRLADGDFSPATPAAAVPGKPLDFAWNMSGPAGNVWLEVFASKTGGFDLQRLGGTVTNSFNAAHAGGQSRIAPSDQVLNHIPEGLYTLVPIVNRVGTNGPAEANPADNWAPIAGKRLYVHNPQSPSCDIAWQTPPVISIKGQATTITGTLINRGSETSPAYGFWVEAMYGRLNPECGFMPAGFFGQGQRLGALAPGETAPYSFAATLPPGIWSVAVLADSTMIVGETDESNNYGLTGIPPYTSGALDLEVESVTIDPAFLAPAQVAPGGTLSWSCRVRNNSGVDSGPVWFELFASETGGLTDSRFGTTLTHSESRSIPASQTLTFSFTVQLNTITDGMYAVTAVVNRAGAGGPDESARINNRKVAPGLVIVHNSMPTETAELTWETGPDIVRNGDSVTITGTVRNTGAVASGPFWVEAWRGLLDTHGIFTKHGILGGNGTYDAGLGAGEARSYNRTFTVAAGWTVGVIADATDLVPEENETDNWAVAP